MPKRRVQSRRDEGPLDPVGLPQPLVGAHQVLVAHVGDVAADSSILRVLAVLLGDVPEGAAPERLLGAPALHLVQVDRARPCRGTAGLRAPAHSPVPKAALRELDTAASTAAARGSVVEM